MLSIMLISFTIVLIIIIMVMLLNTISKKSFNDREKMSPFECGFDPKNSARLPFSLHFFLIAIIFAIFDVELTLFLPMVFITKSMSIKKLLTCMSMFSLILLYGLFHEWNQGALNWAK
uniref:NADH-ubiquinone oxidoreductase chain 3 n=1 Tax=Anisandrus dispar TaxID=748732 RepID=A0A343A6L6_9CUCU|nr:NADH dehydrogenase subunit 3 [Anisandrus dispar]AOY40221.1 NADH dehydrogenase subunit 3 [Anisandrus dispar]